MRRLIAPVLLGMVAMGMSFPAPASALGHTVQGCFTSVVANEVATGGQDTFTGSMSGYIVSPTPGENVSISCCIVVDGSVVACTPRGTGINVAFTAGQVTYTASDTQNVEACAEWTAGGESGSDCEDVTVTDIPPRVVVDTLEGVFRLLADLTAGLDPIICGALQVAGVPGLVNSLLRAVRIDPDDCDVWLVFETSILPCPQRVIDFVPLSDPYSGPSC